jgi:hypothetical protein
VIAPALEQLRRGVDQCLARAGPLPVAKRHGRKHMAPGATLQSVQNCTHCR